MRSAPKLSVGQRLTLTMVLVVVVSGGLGAVLGYQAMRLHLFRPPRRERPPVPRGASFSTPPGPGFQQGGPPPRLAGDRPPPPPEDRGGPGGGPGPGGRRPPSMFGGPMFFINLGAGIIVALAAGFLLSRRFTRPLALLSAGAKALQSGNLDHRVALAGDDEFGRVAASMNQMAERIAAQIQALQADSRRRQQLLADVSHELRSPVTTLRTMAEALRDGVATSPERGERATRAILESALRMERLVNDLIDVARLDLDEFSLHRMPLDLRTAITDCLRRHGHAAEAAGIRLHPLADGPAVMVSGDPHRIAEILDNLVDNAVSHAGERAEVQASVAPGNPVCVVVADTGRGIPAQHLPHIFDAFYRGDPARTPGGRHSGLGLRIARGLAHAHGGDLTLESTEGKGTRALLTLPALQDRPVPE